MVAERIGIGDAEGFQQAGERIQHAHHVFSVSVAGDVAGQRDQIRPLAPDQRADERKQRRVAPIRLGEMDVGEL